MNIKSLITCGLLTVISNSTVAEQTLTTATKQNQLYRAQFFAQYAPRNALEMVELLPGFSFDEGDHERGFGGNAGNVLIDGVRPTSKSGGISAALTRLPANQVAKIELLPGNAGEAGGHALIANVISIKSQTSGSWAMRARHTQHTKTKPNVEAVLRTQIGQWDTAFDLDIGISPFHRTAVVEHYDSEDESLSQASENYAHSNRIDYFNGEGSRPFAGGKLTLNGRLALDKYLGELVQQARATALCTSSMEARVDRTPQQGCFHAPQPENGWSLDMQNRSKLGELGIDWVKTTDDWKLRLIGLTVRNDSQYQYDYHQQSSSGAGVDSHYQQDRLKTETVGRVTYSNIGSATIKPEFGFEVANNRLDTDAQSDQVGALEPVFGSDLMVKELRSEAFANFTYQASDALAIEGGLTYETSEIEVLGDASQNQTFEYIKPRFTASYQIDDDTRLTIEAHRNVGQLSFNDFAANSVADENRTNAGNSELSPTQTDELGATIDWRFSERGSLKVKTFYQWRSDILEQIVIGTDDNGNIEQGLGNAGDGTLFGFIGNLKLPVDDVIPHGLVDFLYRTTNSNFDDPIIADGRAISNRTPEWFKFEFRQDFTAQQFAWGFEYWGSFSYDNFLVDEIQTSSANKTLHWFVETTRFFGVKIQLEVTNSNTSRQPYTRHYYQDTRAGAYLGKTVAKRERNPYFLLSVFGEF